MTQARLYQDAMRWYQLATDSGSTFDVHARSAIEAIEASGLRHAEITQVCVYERGGWVRLEGVL